MSTLPDGEVPGLAIGLGGSGSRCATSSSSTRACRTAAKRRCCATAPKPSRPRRSPTAWCSKPMPPGRSPTCSPASGRRGARRAASPKRPAPHTATATPGRSATTAAMCWASGSAAPIPARSRDSGYEFAAPSCLRLSRSASPRCRFAARRPAPSLRARRTAGDAGALRSARTIFIARKGRRACARIVFPPDGARVELGAARRRDAAGAEAAGRPRAVPLARQRQAAVDIDAGARRPGSPTAPAIRRSPSSTLPAAPRASRCSWKHQGHRVRSPPLCFAPGRLRDTVEPSPLTFPAVAPKAERRRRSKKIRPAQNDMNFASRAEKRNGQAQS